MREVEGRTAFVTGGASGIGLGMAIRFLLGNVIFREVLERQ